MNILYLKCSSLNLFLMKYWKSNKRAHFNMDSPFRTPKKETKKERLKSPCWKKRACTEVQEPTKKKKKEISTKIFETK